MGWRFAVATRLTLITPHPLTPFPPLLSPFVVPAVGPGGLVPPASGHPPPDALSAFCSIYIRFAQQSVTYNPGLLNGARG